MSSEEDATVLEAQESLLYSARNGEASVIKGLLTAKKENKLTFNINCKGCNKSNLGWTPLQLATYFGHVEVVNLLIDAGANLNEVNDDGDTALHKASFIGHEELVILLLTHKAELSILNGEGRTAKDVAKTRDVLRLIEAAEDAERTDKERKLLSAAKEGRVKEIRDLLSLAAPPHINSVDAQGNTCLHAAAYRGHVPVAIMLLQNGIDTFIKNKTGHLAIDLAKDDDMREILSVRPVQRLQKMPTKFEGTLIKKSRFFGWKSYWVILERGSLTYYTCRLDSLAREYAKPRKYLDKAKVVPNDNTNNGFIVTFNDGDVHRLTTPSHIRDYRNVWIEAIRDHVQYSNYYMWGCTYEYKSDPTDVFGDDSKPLGTLQDALDAASANLQVLETQLKECAAIVAALDKCGEASALHDSAYMRFQHACGSGTEALSSLQHCVNLIYQAKDSDKNKLKREKEKNRVLEQALQALARTHHALEMSVAEELSIDKSKRKSNSIQNNSIKCSQYESVIEDKFFDIMADEDDTLVESGMSSPLGTISPDDSPGDPRLSPIEGIPHDEMAINDKLDYHNKIIESEHSLYSAISVASSLGTLVSQGGHVYRNARRNMPYIPRSQLPVAQFSRGDFSLWSVLKNCVGKELSTITMPVVFNEPLSFLQRMLEYLEYGHLLKVAAEQTEPVKRMEMIAAFAVSALASNWERLGKPFNPLLGETFELNRNDYRAVAEQVCHHPPVSAFYAESENYVFHGSVHPKLKFCGKSVEIHPKGQITVELPGWGEAYTWNNVNCCVHNVIVGKLWIEQYGQMEVVCHGGQKLRANLTFKPSGFNNRDLHAVDGFIVDSQNKRLRYLYGKWTQYIKCCPMMSLDQATKDRLEEESSNAHTPKKVLAKLNSFKVGALRSMSIQDNDEPERSADEIPQLEESHHIDIPFSYTLWEAEPRPPNSSQYYNFTSFAMSLNEIEPDLEDVLCPTDSRLRPDIRLLERGDIDGAAAEKARLEEKQRAAKKGLKKENKNWEPRWFSLGTNPYTKQDDWMFNGGYFNRNYDHLKNVNIF